MNGSQSAVRTAQQLAILFGFFLCSMVAAVSGEEGGVRRLSLSVGRIGDAPLAMNDRVRGLSFSADGTRLFAVADNVASFDWRERKRERYLWAPREGQTLTRVLFSPDGKLFARLENGEKVHLHSAVDTRLLRVLEGRGSSSTAASWAPDSKLIACGGVGEIGVWNVETGELVRRIPQGKNHVTSLSFSPDGGRIAASNREKLEVDPGQMLVHRMDGTPGPVVLEGGVDRGWSVPLAFSPDGESIAGSNDSRFFVWNAETGKVSWQHRESGFDFASFSADGSLVATGGLNRLQVFDVRSGEERFRHENEHINVHWWSGAFSPDGTVLAAGAGSCIKFWDTGTWEPIDPAGDHRSPVNALAFTPDGKHLVTGDLAGRVILWDWERKSLVWIWDRPTSSWGIQALSVSGDGTLIGVNSPNQKSENVEAFHLLDLKTGARLRSFGGPYFRHGRLVFSRDNKSGYTGSGGGGVEEWDLRSGTLRRVVGSRRVKVGGREERRSVRDVVFPPDGEESIWWIGGYQGLALRRLSDGVDHRVLEGGSHHPGGAIEVSPDNNWLTGDGRVWSLPGGRVIYQGSTHTGVPYPYGRFLAGARGDNRAQIIDVLSRVATREIDFGEGEVAALAFSPDGSTLVAGGDGGVKFVELKGGAMDGVPAFGSRATPRGPGATAQQLWEVMGGDDAWAAYQAGWKLAQRDDFLAFLGEVLEPTAEPSEESTRALRLLLRDASFEVRLSAARSLNDQGVVLSKEDEQALREEGPNPLQYRRSSPSQEPGGAPRLRPMPALLPLSNRLRSSRAVMLLEQDGSAWAIEILKTLAAGYAESPQTMEATWALRRLGQS